LGKNYLRFSRRNKITVQGRGPVKKGEEKRRGYNPRTPKPEKSTRKDQKRGLHEEKSAAFGKKRKTKEVPLQK